MSCVFSSSLSLSLSLSLPLVHSMQRRHWMDAEYNEQIRLVITKLSVQKFNTVRCFLNLLAVMNKYCVVLYSPPNCVRAFRCLIDASCCIYIPHLCACVCLCACDSLILCSGRKSQTIRNRHVGGKTIRQIICLLN